MFGLFIAVGIVVVAMVIAANNSQNNHTHELEQRKQRELQKPQNTAVLSPDFSMRSGLDDIVDAALGTTELTPDIFKDGPTEAYLRHFQNTHPCPSDEDHMTIIELQLSLQHYMEAEQELRLMSPQTLPEDLQMRYINAILKLYIMTGRTEMALDSFTQYQQFAEQLLQVYPRGILSYLDNAATVTALAGDFETADKYCEAMHNYVVSNNIRGMNYLLPEITKVRILYLENKPTEAKAMLSVTRKRIEEFPSYSQAWNQAFLHDLLDQTRLFDMSAMEEEGFDDEMPGLDVPATALSEPQSDDEMPTLEI